MLRRFEPASPRPGVKDERLTLRLTTHAAHG